MSRLHRIFNFIKFTMVVQSCTVASGSTETGTRLVLLMGNAEEKTYYPSMLQWHWALLNKLIVDMGLKRSYGCLGVGLWVKWLLPCKYISPLTEFSLWKKCWVVHEEKYECLHVFNFLMKFVCEDLFESNIWSEFCYSETIISIVTLVMYLCVTTFIPLKL